MDLEIGLKDLERVRVVDGPDPVLAEGEARVRIDRFGLSSNNITYAVMGEALQYWTFFPAAEPDPGDVAGWGRLPVWGFGDVVESRSPDLDEGERLFGYFPMSSGLVIKPGARGTEVVHDTAPHRAERAAAYNGYRICRADPLYRVALEDLQMLLYPLFFTSFLVDDFLDEHADFGAERIVISSASSKTAIGVAWSARRRRRSVTGLTSAANADFVRSLDVYDSVIVYDDLEPGRDSVRSTGKAVLAGGRSVYIDVAGNQAVTAAVHGQADLGYSMIVGDTHWDSGPAARTGPLPGPEPKFLFAPARISQRTREWGAAELATRVAARWREFAAWAGSWIELHEAAGPDEVTAVYHGLLAGRVDPRIGHICRLVAGGRS